MEPVHPDTLVHAVQPAPRSVLAHAERVDTRVEAARRDTPQVGPLANIDDPMRYENIGKDADGAFVAGGRVAGHRVDSPEALEIVKNINTKSDLKISRWTEIAGYLRWGTLGMMTLAFSAFTAAATAGAPSFLAGIGELTLATVGTALISPPFLALTAISLAMATTGLLMTQHVRKLQADRFMDVQGFMQERAATKIGKEVAQQLGQLQEHSPRSDGKRWQDVVSTEQAQGAEQAR